MRYWLVSAAVACTCAAVPVIRPAIAPGVYYDDPSRFGGDYVAPDPMVQQAFYQPTIEVRPASRPRVHRAIVVSHKSSEHQTRRAHLAQTKAQLERMVSQTNQLGRKYNRELKAMEPQKHDGTRAN
jgi:hypothetical protein